MSSQKIEKEDALHLAMLYCQHALDHVGTNKDRLIKTDILLLMVAIARSMGKNSWTQERHFYHAVEIARSCLRKDFLMTDHGKKIKKCFDEYIDPNWSKMFKNSWDNQVLAQLQLHIANESNARQAYRMKQAEDTKNYISAIDTSDKILDKLQSALSDPFRLIIIEAESGIISMCHNIERTEAEALEENSHGIRTIHADVFHKPKTYQYIIDRGSREGTSQFSEDQIK